MIKSNLYDYSHAYILVSGTIIIGSGSVADNATTQADERNKGINI